MTAGRAALDVLDDLMRRPDEGDAIILRIVGLGLSAGLVLVWLGMWLSRKGA